jgi:indole-3-glycerol phosphate synthase
MIVSGILHDILQTKLREVRALSDPAIRMRIAQRLKGAPAPRSLGAALRHGEGFRIIAEMKRASPSRGLMAREYDPAAIAAEYTSGGAAALSVLTDRPYFKGEGEHLFAARAISSLPVLRKDFIVDVGQVEESRALGADALLLIAALLEERTLKALRSCCESLGMEALVEVHDAEDLAKALAAGATLVGVNNRDLSTFRVSLDVSLRLAERIPTGIVRVSESGIGSRSDLERLAQAGYDAFLIGEALMTGPDRRARLREWLS